MTQVLVNGIYLGSLFTVIAVGLTLVYGVMEVPNFAHAGVIVLAAYTTWAVQDAGSPFIVAVVAGVLCGGMVSVATEFFAYRFVHDKPAAAPAIALGLLLILQNSALRVWGGEGKALNAPYDGWRVTLVGVTIPGVKIAVVIAAVVSLGLLALVLGRTSLGRAIRAVAQDRGAAALLGIPIRRQYVLAFFIAGVLGGVAAVAYAPTYQVSPFMADGILLSAFVVVVLGGLGSITGAVLGGLSLGLVESAGAAYVSTSYQSAFGFILLVAVLVLRPAGLRSVDARRVA